MEMDGKTAVITGGAGGIGGGTARMFAGRGAKSIWLADIDDVNGEKLAEELREFCACEYRHVDVTSEEAVLNFFEGIGSSLDVMFNCAGITSVKGLMETDAALWNRIMGVNVTSAFLFSREAMRIMSAQKSGCIVNVSSISAYVGGIRTSPAYAASKAAIIGLTRALAKYGAPVGVRVNAVVPGLVDTDMTRAKDFVYSTSEVPLGYIAKTSDIAGAVLFLAGEAGNYITGQCLNINGGMYFA
ncbi:MAG: SDR family oxidoreductase [Treponema sp.]|jgi:NAD(P)-dependent dehydrogenase (short-subunit alcohol dehydrogenase family)|nr:SDR family oxidoreductase [Treponema sp.]